MYLILITLAVAATALPVPEESPPDRYSPLIITAPESMLRTNVLAAFLMPSNASPLKYDSSNPLLQLIQKPDMKDIDAVRVTGIVKESEAIKEIDTRKPGPNLPLFASGSGTFTLNEEEPQPTLFTSQFADHEKELGDDKDLNKPKPSPNLPSFASGSGTFTLDDKNEPDPNIPLFTSELTEYDKESGENEDKNKPKPKPNLPLFASGSGTFTLDQNEPDTFVVAYDKIPPHSTDSETPWVEPAEIITEGLTRPDEPIEPADNSPEESSEEIKDEIPIELEQPDIEHQSDIDRPTVVEHPSAIEPALEISPPMPPTLPIESPPISELYKPIVTKPKPSIFSWRPSFLSFLYPDRWYTSSKLSLSSLPVLSHLNLQSIPYLPTTINLASSAFANALPKVRSSSDDEPFLITVISYPTDPDKTNMPYESRYYLHYVEPVEKN